MNIGSSKEFKALLRQKGFKYREGNQGWMRINCLTCDVAHGKKMRRYVHPNVSSSHCFICNEYIFLDDLLGEKIEFTGKTDDYENYEHPQAREFPFSTAIPINKLAINHPAIEFLKKDHFYNFDELFEKYWVYFIPEGCEKEIKFDKGEDKPTIIRPFDSLVFPVFFNQELVGWQCRFIPGTPNGERFKKMKYFHVFNKGNYLYNFDNAKKSEYVVTFEGIKKSWKHPSAGVATLGKGISSQQIQLLQNNWKRIIFFLDSDAQEEADIHLTQLRFNGRETININPEDYGVKSPDELTHKQVQKIIESKL